MRAQRITVGNTLVIECFVDGCGIGIGDVHGAQGDGEVSITAIEMEALVKVCSATSRGLYLLLPT